MNKVAALFLIVACLLANLTAAFNSAAVSITRKNDISMKIFDWKKRDGFDKLVLPADYSPSVSNLFPIPGSRKKFLRVGRGISAGQGKTAGRGMRGQKSRSGEGAGVRAGFEGGQTALYRRLPKFVGKPMKGHTKTVYELVALEVLNDVKDGATVDYAMLMEEGLVTKANKGREIYKVVGGAELKTKGLVVSAHAFTVSAKAAIEGNGGKCILLSPTRHIPLDQALAEAAAVSAEKLIKLKELRSLKAKRDAAKLSV